MKMLEKKLDVAKQVVKLTEVIILVPVQNRWYGVHRSTSRGSKEKIFFTILEKVNDLDITSDLLGNCMKTVKILFDKLEQS